MHFDDGLTGRLRVPGTRGLRSFLLAGAALALLSPVIVVSANAAGGQGGTSGANVGGNGGSSSGGGAGRGTGDAGANGQGAAGGTAYKGVGSPFGTGGGGGGTGSANGVPASTGGNGGGLGAAGQAGSGAGQAGGTAGANGNGAGTATLTNTTPLVAGGGGASAGGLAVVGQGGGGSGGIGALVTGAGQSTNTSTIAGGSGAGGGTALSLVGGGGGGAGGFGALFTASGAGFTNSGDISGGGGGTTADSLSTVGSGGGGAGGAGVVFTGNRASFTNLATVTAGNGGNTGSTLAFVGGGGGGEGGIGVLFVGANSVFANIGTVIGGSGGATGSALRTNGDGGGGGGGDAVRFNGANAVLTNTGNLVGGNGGGTNDALVFAGQGGGGEGGAGARFSGRNARATNTGTVRGGNGGSTGFYLAATGVAAGGDGGAGMIFSASGARLTNRATIAGGTGGRGDAGNGVGGVGVRAAGIVIDNTGSISGGLGGNGGPQAFAIVLTGGRNFIGGTGAINGGIDVRGTSIFQPALPGSPAGAQPLAINGPLVFAQTSTYRIRIGATNADRVVVTGTATLGGAKVRAVVQPVAYAPGSTRYTILTASAGRVGTFSGVSSTSAFVLPILTYDANNAYLTIRKLRFATAAITQNQRAVAGALDSANLNASNRTGAGGRIIGALNTLSAPQARAAFDSLSGEGITGAQNIAHRASELFTSSIFDQTTFYNGGASNSVTLTEPAPAFVALAAAQGQPIRELADLPARQAEPVFVAPARSWRAWANGFGATEHISGNAFPIGSATQNNDIYGGVLGVDYQLTPDHLVGVALGGTDGAFRVGNRGTSGSTTGGHIAAYSLHTIGAWYGASSTSFSYFDNRTTRLVGGFGGLANETERGSFGSQAYRTRLEIGRHFAAYGGTITPFVALEIASLRTNGFGETAVSGPGLFRLAVNGQSAADVPAFVGARYQGAMHLGGFLFSPSLQVAYVHEFAPYRSLTNNLVNLPGATFLIDGARPARDAAQVKAGGELALGAHSALFASFEGEFSGINQLYAGKGGFRYLW